MKSQSVRIVNISLENFKNIKKGSVSLENNRKSYRASVLGVYGQNGSGKTALIDAIALLKHVLCGQQIPNRFADFINVDAATAKLSFQFKINSSEEMFNVWYEFKLQKASEDSLNADDNDEQIEHKVEIIDEVLSYSIASKKTQRRKSVLIDTRTTGVFVPKIKFVELVGDNREKDTDLLVNKKFIRATSRGFIFSREMINVFRRNCRNEIHMKVIDGLFTYGNRELFVINTENSGLISLNALPLSFKYKDNHSEAIGNLMIPLDNSVQIPETAFDLVKRLISVMNIVVEQIVPGLTIGIKDLGTVLYEGGQIGKTIQLVSVKNNKEIPFQYESEGIKKIVSILQLLVVVYNNPSITVAIDEIDAGIFEYLLGEILNIISEKGKGQLVFTSHNLRPLETIDKGFIAFTTTNPNKRYVRMINVKGNNNLRDFYYRDIVLGEQNEQLYNPTNNFDIALAFREAGEMFGT